MQLMRLAVGLFCLPLAGIADNAVLKRSDVAKAIAFIQAANESTLTLQVNIAEIPAPTFHEAERAKFIEAEFRRVGLARVEIDKQGNVLGWRDGQVPDTFVLAAHLDIAFEPGLNTKVRKAGNRWYGPGLSDDSRGLASLLTIAEAMNQAEIKTRQTILFVANVGEEGNGDLNGVRYLFKESPYRDRFRAFISIDGTSPEADSIRIVNGGTGVKRYLVALHGPGGHSYGNFGRPSAIHAAGRIISRLADMDVPQSPKTTFNVGRITGGTSVNAIAETCSFEVDMRSEDPGMLDRIEVMFLEAVRLGAEEENKASSQSKAALSFETRLIGNRPAGITAESQPLVQAARWAAAVTKQRAQLFVLSSDSNLPISLGIPAITMSGGGIGGNHHSKGEFYEPVNPWKGPQAILLTILDFDSRQ